MVVNTGEESEKATCISCGQEVASVDDTWYQSGSTEGILSCPNCRASLLPLLPNDCPLCGYFLKKPFGTSPGPLGIRCAKCKHPITLKTASQIQKQAQQAAEVASEAHESTAPLPSRSRVSTTALWVLAVVCATLVAAMFFLRNSSAPTVTLPPASTTSDSARDIQGELTAAQTEVERLRAEKEAERRRQQLTPGQAPRSTNGAPAPAVSTPPRTESNQGGASRPPTEESTTEAPSAPPSGDAPPKTAADSYLDAGKAVSPSKGGG